MPLSRNDKPKTIPGQSYPLSENSIGSVVIEILSYIIAFKKGIMLIC